MSHLTGSLTASQEGVHPGTGTGRGNFKLNTVTVYKIEALIEKKKKRTWDGAVLPPGDVSWLVSHLRLRGKKKKQHILFFFFLKHIFQMLSLH